MQLVPSRGWSFVGRTGAQFSGSASTERLPGGPNSGSTQFLQNKAAATAAATAVAVTAAWLPLQPQRHSHRVGVPLKKTAWSGCFQGASHQVERRSIPLR